MLETMAEGLMQEAGAGTDAWSGFSSLLFGGNKSYGLFGKGGGFDVTQTGGSVLGLGSALGQLISGRAQGDAAQASGQILQGLLGIDRSWIETGEEMTGLQEMGIGITGSQERRAIYEKWYGRHGSVQARYAKAGISVTGEASEAPMVAAGKLLESMDEEIRYSKLNERLKVFNEVTIPNIKSRSEISRSTYQSDITRIQSETTAKIAKTKATTALISGIASTAFKAFTGFAGAKA